MVDKDGVFVEGAAMSQAEGHGRTDAEPDAED